MGWRVEFLLLRGQKTGKGLLHIVTAISLDLPVFLEAVTGLKLTGINQGERTSQLKLWGLCPWNHGYWEDALAQRQT